MIIWIARNSTEVSCLSRVCIMQHWSVSPYKRKIYAKISNRGISIYVYIIQI